MDHLDAIDAGLAAKRPYNEIARKVFLTYPTRAFVGDEDHGIDPVRVRHALDEFEKELPADYKLAAAEAVNGTKARQLRSHYLTKLILESRG
ncbi:MAG: hypothetical protein JSR38_08950 [Proteobacteria bacterium]|jgi:hypothetical protein|nr:hypothetical protein [Pseudomonadota bacterium]